jgi:hypothetical protein
MDKATTNNCHESSVGHFVTEASTLGIPVGQAPSSIPTSLGNKQDLLLVAVDPTNNLYYKQEFGVVRLVVFND